MPGQSSWESNAVFCDAVLHDRDASPGEFVIEYLDEFA
jgi:hypothetical protein